MVIGGVIGVIMSTIMGSTGNNSSGNNTKNLNESVTSAAPSKINLNLELLSNTAVGGSIFTVSPSFVVLDEFDNPVSTFN